MYPFKMTREPYPLSLQIFVSLLEEYSSPHGYFQATNICCKSGPSNNSLFSFPYSPIPALLIVLQKALLVLSLIVGQ